MMQSAEGARVACSAALKEEEKKVEVCETKRKVLASPPPNRLVLPLHRNPLASAQARLRVPGR